MINFFPEDFDVSADIENPLFDLWKVIFLGEQQNVPRETLSGGWRIGRYLTRYLFSAIRSDGGTKNI